MFRIPSRKMKPKACAIMATPRKKTSALPIPKLAKKISDKRSFLSAMVVISVCLLLNPVSAFSLIKSCSLNPTCYPELLLGY
uniref:Uncharacterized protein n=1 Tax=Picea sitchensis TaxID=3332 RepID=D5ADF4_PICSI|nr:unknown [Picea sitchensis]